MQAYDAAMNTSTEDLEQNSELFRQLKADYINQGLPPEEAALKAKEDVANRAYYEASAMAAPIAAAAGTLMDKAVLAKPLTGQFTRSSVKSIVGEGAQESAEGLDQFGANIAARNTYNNDQDLLEGVGAQMGQQGIAAGIGAGVAGGPHALLAGGKDSALAKAAGLVGKATTAVGGVAASAAEAVIPSVLKTAGAAGLGAVAGAAKGVYDSTLGAHFRAKDKAEAVNSIKTAAADVDAIRASQPAEDSVDDNGQKQSANVKAATSEVFDKIKNFNPTVQSDEEAKHIASTMKGFVLPEKGDDKFEAFDRNVQIISDALEGKKPSGGKFTAGDTKDSLTKFNILRAVKGLSDYHEELFGSKYSRDEIANAITASSKETQAAKERILTAYDNYQRLANQPKYRQLLDNADKYAQETVKTTDDLASIFNNSKLSDEEKEQQAGAVLDAYKHLIWRNQATPEQLSKAEELIKQYKENGQNKDQYDNLQKDIESTVLFQSRINHAEQKQQQINAEIAKDNKIINQKKGQKGRHKTLEQVAEEINSGFVGNDSNKVSMHSLVTKYNSAKTNEERSAVLYQTARFIQTLQNKLKKFGESKRDYTNRVEAFKLRTGRYPTKAEVAAKCIPYNAWNSKKQEFVKVEPGIYAGRIDLAKYIADEIDGFKVLYKAFLKQARDLGQGDCDINVDEYDSEADPFTSRDYIESEYASYINNRKESDEDEDEGKDYSPDDFELDDGEDDDTATPPSSSSKDEPKGESKEGSKEGTKAPESPENNIGSVSGPVHTDEEGAKGKEPESGSDTKAPQNGEESFELEDDEEGDEDSGSEDKDHGTISASDLAGESKEPDSNKGKEPAKQPETVKKQITVNTSKWNDKYKTAKKDLAKGRYLDDDEVNAVFAKNHCYLSVVSIKQMERYGRTKKAAHQLWFNISGNKLSKGIPEHFKTGLPVSPFPEEKYKLKEPLHVPGMKGKAATSVMGIVFGLQCTKDHPKGNPELFNASKEDLLAYRKSLADKDKDFVTGYLYNGKVISEKDARLKIFREAYREFLNVSSDASTFIDNLADNLNEHASINLVDWNTGTYDKDSYIYNGKTYNQHFSYGTVIREVLAERMLKAGDPKETDEEYAQWLMEHQEEEPEDTPETEGNDDDTAAIKLPKPDDDEGFTTFLTLASDLAKQGKYNDKVSRALTDLQQDLLKDVRNAENEEAGDKAFEKLTKVLEVQEAQEIQYVPAITSDLISEISNDLGLSPDKKIERLNALRKILTTNQKSVDPFAGDSGDRYLHITDDKNGYPALLRQIDLAQVSAETSNNTFVSDSQSALNAVDAGKSSITKALDSVTHKLMSLDKQLNKLVGKTDEKSTKDSLEYIRQRAEIEASGKEFLKTHKQDETLSSMADSGNVVINTLRKSRRVLFGFQKESFKSKGQLLNAIYSSIFKANPGTKDLSRSDAIRLLKALDTTNKNSDFNKIKNCINALLEGTINEGYKAPFRTSDNASPFYEIAAKNRITFKEALKVLLDSAKTGTEISNSEMSQLLRAFPVLAFCDIDTSAKEPKLVIDEDVAMNLFLNGMAHFNHTFANTGNWDRLAQSLDMDEYELRHDYIDSNGNNQGMALLEQLSQGSTETQLYNSLIGDIHKSMGLRFSNEVEYATAQQVENLMADVLVGGLQDANIIESHDFDAIGNGITVWSVTYDRSALNSALFNPTQRLENTAGLDYLLQNENADNIGRVSYVGSEFEPSDPPKYILHTQLATTEKQRHAAQEYEKIPFMCDTGLYAIINIGLGEDGVVSVLGEDTHDAEHMDPDDRASKESVNLSIRTAMRQCQVWYQQIANEAIAQGVPVSQIAKHFKIGFTKAGRIQELEACGPVTSKVTREIFLPTWNTFSMSDAKAKDDLARAIIQNMGGHLNKKDFEKTSAAFNALVRDMLASPARYTNVMALATKPASTTAESLQNAFKELNDFFTTDGKEEFGENGIDLSKVDKSFMGLHAMETLARYVKAIQENQTEFTTSIYCEADGTTNGPINAQYLYTVQLVDDGKTLISLLDKGNQRLGDYSGNPAGISKDGLTDGNRDLYELVGKLASDAMNSQFSTEGNGWYNRNNHIVTYKDPSSSDNSYIVKPFRDAPEYVRKNPFKDPLNFLGALSDLFRLSGMTKDAISELQEKISRTFMKDPVTKGGYYAGLRSICTGLLVGSRNCNGIINDMHQKATAVRRALAKYEGKFDEMPEGEELDLICAKAMFGSLKGTEEWSDKDYLDNLNAYMAALQMLMQTELVVRQGETKDDPPTLQVKGRYAGHDYGAMTYPCKCKGKNTRAFKKFSIASFMSPDMRTAYMAKQLKDNDEAAKDAELNETANKEEKKARVWTVAPLGFSLKDPFAQHLVDAIETVYGKPIYNAMREVVRGDGVAKTQNTIRTFSSLVTTLINLAGIQYRHEFDPYTETTGSAKKRLGEPNSKDNPLSNRVDFETGVLPLAPSSKTSKQVDAGGSLNNPEHFARYTHYSEDNNVNKIKYRGKHLKEIQFNTLDNPGVAIIPLLTILTGDASMMTNALTDPEFMKKLHYAVTLIFDGLNAAVGQLQEAGESINEIQWRTNQTNNLISFQEKLKAIQQYFATEQGKTLLKNITSNMVNVLKMEKQNLSDFVKNETPVNALTNSYLQLRAAEWNDKVASLSDSENEDAINELFADRAAKIKDFVEKDPNRYVYYENDCFNSNQADIFHVKQAVKKIVFQRFCTLVGDGNYYDGFAKLFKDKKIDPSSFTINFGRNKGSYPEGYQSTDEVKDQYITELKEYLNLMSNMTTEITQSKPDENNHIDITYDADTYKTVDQLTAQDIQELLFSNFNNLTQNMGECARNISYIQAAKWLMGGTFDHMASNDKPFVFNPIEHQAEFHDMLTSLNLKMSGRFTEEALWKTVFNKPHCPYQRLCEITEIIKKDPVAVNDPEIQAARGKVLKELLELVQKRCEYVEPETTQGLEYLHQEQADNKNVKEYSAQKILNLGSNDDRNHVSRMLSTFFHDFKVKGLNDKTKVKVITGSTYGKAKQAFAKVVAEDFGHDFKKEGLNALPSEIQATYMQMGKPGHENDPVEFYSPNTNCIYIVPTSGAAAVSAREERILAEQVIPHEIMHALAWSTLKHYLDKFEGITDKNQLTDDNDKVAFATVNRIKRLKQLVDNELPSSISKSCGDTMPELYSYISQGHRGNESNGALQEFLACFGTMSNAELKRLKNVLTDNAKLNRELDNLVSETKTSASKIGRIIESLKNLLMDFFGRLFGTDRRNLMIRDLVQANVALTNTLYIEEKNNKTAKSTETAEQSVDENTEAGVQSEIDFGFFTRTNHAKFSEPSDSETNGPLTDLYNNLDTLVQKRFQYFDTDTLKKNIDIGNKFAKYSSNALTRFYKPIHNLGYKTGEPKEFAQTVAMLSFFKDIKAPFYVDVARAAAHVIGELTPEQFVTAPKGSVDASSQLKRAENLCKMLQGFRNRKAKFNPSEATAVIFALAQTDPEFKRVLSNMEKRNTHNTRGYLSIDKAFDSAIRGMRNWFTDIRKQPNKYSKNYDEALTRLLGELESCSRSYDKTSYLERFRDNAELAVSSKINEALMKVTHASNTDELNAAIEAEANTLNNSVHNMKAMPHVAKELLNDTIGRTKETHKTQALITKIKITLDQNRQEAIDLLPGQIKKRFKVPLSKKTWEKLTVAVGKTGLSTLMKGNPAKLGLLLIDDNVFYEEMNQLKTVITDKYRQAKCKQLAEYMMTGKVGKFLLRNPMAIAAGFTPDGSLYAPTREEFNACDQLTSMYAVQMLSKSDRYKLAELLDKEPDGMKYLLGTAEKQYRDGIDKAQNYNRGNYNWIKGSTFSIMKDDGHFKVAPLTDKDAMEAQGYTLIDQYHGSNMDFASLGVYYSKLDTSSALNAGGLTYVGTTCNGINAFSGVSLAPNAGVITNSNTIDKILTAMSEGREYATNEEELIPIFGSNGDVIAFERSLNPDLLNNNEYLNPVKDYAQLLARQAGRNEEESLAENLNNELVNRLADFWDEANKPDSTLDAEPKDFVNIFDIKDPTVKAMVDLMPRKLIKSISKAYGGPNKFMVLRSQVNDVIGYHSISITDMWTGETRLNPAVTNAIAHCAEAVFGKKAFARLKRVENITQDLVKMAKNSIIIRSINVPVSNMGANYLQLAMEGVPVSSMFRYTKDVLHELDKYLKIRSDLLQVKTELGSMYIGSRDRAQLESRKRLLENAIDGLSISYLIKQKEFSSIADLGNDVRDIASGKMSLDDKIMEKLDSLSNNEIVKSFVHYGMVAPDTSLYKFLEKMNQYGDFLGKAILFKDLTERQHKSQEDAHYTVSEEFVDYVRLPGRTRDFAERIGLIWFSNFKLRMMKVALRMLREKPLATLAFATGGLNSPLVDSLFGKLGVLGYSIGPGMLSSIFTANPWVKLFGLL